MSPIISDTVLLFTLLLFPVYAANLKCTGIKVSTTKYFSTPPSNLLYLCSRRVVDERRNSSTWPSGNLIIPRSDCLSYEDFLLHNNWQSKLTCVLDTTKVLFEALDLVGIKERFIAWGNLIGWVRHNHGLIPWDYDGDIALTKESCRSSMKELKKRGHRNIAQALQEILPEGYMMARIAKSDDHNLDVFDDCEQDEIRIEQFVDGQRTCFVDLWFTTRESTPNSGCTCDDDVPSPRMCFNSFDAKRGCFAEEDIFPLTKELLSNTVKVEVPKNAEKVVKRMYPDGVGIENLASVPVNVFFEYGWSMVVADERSPFVVTNHPSTIRIALLALAVSLVLLVIFSFCHHNKKPDLSVVSKRTELE